MCSAPSRTQLGRKLNSPRALCAPPPKEHSWVASSTPLNNSKCFVQAAHAELKLQATSLRQREAEQLTRAKEINQQAEGLVGAEARLQALQAQVQVEAAALGADQQAVQAGAAGAEAAAAATSVRATELDGKLVRHEHSYCSCTAA